MFLALVTVSTVSTEEDAQGYITAPTYHGTNSLCP